MRVIILIICLGVSQLSSEQSFVILSKISQIYEVNHTIDEISHLIGSVTYLKDVLELLFNNPELLIETKVLKKLLNMDH